MEVRIDKSRRVSDRLCKGKRERRRESREEDKVIKRPLYQEAWGSIGQHLAASVKY